LEILLRNNLPLVMIEIMLISSFVITENQRLIAKNANKKIKSFVKVLQMMGK